MGVLGLVTFFLVKGTRDFFIGAPTANNHKEVFTIESSERTAAIADRLEKQGFIKNSFVFKLVLKKMGLDGKIQAGEYDLSRNLTAPRVALILTHGAFDRKITLIEGWRIEEMADYLVNHVGIKREDFLSNAQEGFMFPDTYFVKKGISGQAIAKLMRNNFDSKFNQTLTTDAKKRGLTRDQMVILASIVEREARTSEERPVIAGILLKRLRIGMPLEADATIQYGLGYQVGEKSWWKKNLTEDDLQIDSPYNTRKNPGLPPTPIGNPGLEAIKAVIYPADSPYLYYLHDKNGHVYYAKTIEEHIANIAKYLR